MIFSADHVGGHATVCRAIGALFTLPAEGVALEDVKRSLVKQALERTGGNKSHAARLLGLTRATLRYRIEKMGLDAGASDDVG